MKSEASSLDTGWENASHLKTLA